MARDKDLGGAFELSSMLTPASGTNQPPYDLVPDGEPDEIRPLISYTRDEERAVVKKLDRRLVLFVAFLYLLSFLDRSSKHAHIM